MESRVRIIGGSWKRTPLPVLAVEGLRPTPDRVRETLFNWLGQDLTGWHCLDLFAGSGALGLEAASRGAAQVTMVEQNARLCRSLVAVRQRLGAAAVEIVQADALQWLTTAPARRFDLILLDPPFHRGWVGKLLPRVGDVLADGGRVYVECESALTDAAASAAAALRVIRSDRAGQVHYHLLAR